MANEMYERYESDFKKAASKGKDQLRKFIGTIDEQLENLEKEEDQLTNYVEHPMDEEFAENYETNNHRTQAILRRVQSHALQKLRSMITAERTASGRKFSCPY